jgi:UDP-N-acetylglucosamine 1-carboxyvinyltransferase
MEGILVKGGRRLEGIINISGAKNAALPIMAASLLPHQGRTRLLNVPMVDDVLALGRALGRLGARVNLAENCALIDNSSVNNHIMPLKESKEFRASVLVTGPLLARFGQALVTEPGGDLIGNRPIDLHIAGFKALGAEIRRVDKQYLRVEADHLKGNEIVFRFPSVGATENLMMAACLAEGKTELKNAAREPEIVDLANFLTCMGARIKGAGSSTIRIDGVKELGSREYTVMPDRIETGTYIVAAAITHGDVLLKNSCLNALRSVVSELRKIGVKIEEVGEGVRIASSDAFHPTDLVTGVYPGFPTDMQPIVTPLLSIAKGESTIKETIFNHRFNHVPELRKMGAKILVRGNTIFIKGVSKLRGAEVRAHDLRSGGSLILAGLVAEGGTTIRGVDQILRGYEKPVEKLRNVGAELSYVDK